MNNRIKDLRTLILKEKYGKKYTQKEFADKLGLSENYIWQIEKGERIPSDRTIADICREFNVNERWLRTGEGEPFRKLSDDEQLALALGKLMRVDDTKETTRLKKALIAEMLNLDESAWQYVLTFIKKIAQSVEKTEEQG